MTLRRPARRATLASATLVLSMIGAGSAVAASGTPSGDTPAAPSKSYSAEFSHSPAKTRFEFKKVPFVGHPAVTGSPAIDITSISVEDGVLYPLPEDSDLPAGFSPIGATVEITGSDEVADINTIKPLVGINGTGRGPGLLYPGTLLTKNRYGVGKARLGSSQISYVGTDGHTHTLTDTTKSNYFQIRAGTDGDFKGARTGSTVKFAVWVVKFHPSKQRWVSAGSAFIQFQSGDTWVNLKKVSLDSTGHAKYSFKPRSEHLYRLYEPTTSTVQGGNAELPGPL